MGGKIGQDRALEGVLIAQGEVVRAFLRQLRAGAGNAQRRDSGFGQGVCRRQRKGGVIGAQHDADSGIRQGLGAGGCFARVGGVVGADQLHWILYAVEGDAGSLLVGILQAQQLQLAPWGKGAGLRLQHADADRLHSRLRRWLLLLPAAAQQRGGQTQRQQDGKMLF